MNMSTCPWCGSEDDQVVDNVIYDFGPDEVDYVIRCGDCDQEYTEVFQLTEVISDNGLQLKSMLEHDAKRFLKYLNATGWAAIGFGPDDNLDSIYVQDAHTIMRWFLEFKKDGKVADIEETIEYNRRLDDAGL